MCCLAERLFYVREGLVLSINGMFILGQLMVCLFWDN